MTALGGWLGKIRNPKPEIRMNAQNQNARKKERLASISGFGFGASFGFRVSGFGFRNSGPIEPEARVDTFTHRFYIRPHGGSLGADGFCARGFNDRAIAVARV
jgi:hypothetical protein